MLVLLPVLCPVPPVEVPINPVIEVKAEVLEGITLRANVPFTIRRSAKPSMRNVYVHSKEGKYLHFYTEEWARRAKELEGGPPRTDDDEKIFMRHIEIQRWLGNLVIDPSMKPDTPEHTPIAWWMLALPPLALLTWRRMRFEIIEIAR